MTVLDDLGLALTADGLMEAQYADLPVREYVRAYAADAALRCDGCGHALTTVRECDLPGGTRFRLCPVCRMDYLAMEVRE